MKRGDAVNILFRPVALLTHNANIVFMVFELLVNRLRFHATHFTFAIIFGLLYIVFSWVLYSRIKLFYYFFLDYNRKDNIIVYTGLATVVSLTLSTNLHVICTYISFLLFIFIILVIFSCHCFSSEATVCPLYINLTLTSRCQCCRWPYTCVSN